MLLQSPAVLILMALLVVALFLYWNLRERMASRAEKKRSRHVPTTQKGIRMLFPTLAMVLVAQLLGVQLGSSFAIPSGLSLTLAALGHLLFWSGLLLSFWARETLGHNWAHAADYQVIPGQQLVIRGPYRLIRHPIYTGLLMIFLGVELIAHSWLAVLVIPIFLFLRWQARREDQLLRSAFGSHYETYIQSTGMFFPFVTTRRRDDEAISP